MEPFLLETTDCALVNNFTVDGTATAHTDCRMYWSGMPSNMLTVELTIPNMTGSFLSPGAGWLRASVHVPVADVSGELTSTMFPFDELPSTLTDTEIALDYSPSTCSNIGSAMLAVDTMADVGDKSGFFSLSFSGMCAASSGMSAFTGGFILTAAAKDGSITNGDPGMLVTPTE